MPEHERFHKKDVSHTDDEVFAPEEDWYIDWPKPHKHAIRKGRSAKGETA